MSDLIDRQAAIDAIARIAREKFNLSDEYNHYLAGLMDGELAIKNLPTIQPEPHEGHWIWVAGELMCSECRTIFTDLYPDYDNSVACPHCGAKMRGKTK